MRKVIRTNIEKIRGRWKQKKIKVDEIGNYLEMVGVAKDIKDDSNWR